MVFGVEERERVRDRLIEPARADECVVACALARSASRGRRSRRLGGSCSRDHALTLACLREGLETAHARGFDRLPASVLREAEAALVRSPDGEELLRALRAAVELLLAETGGADDRQAALAAQLRELTEPGPLDRGRREV